MKKITQYIQFNISSVREYIYRAGMIGLITTLLIILSGSLTLAHAKRDLFVSNANFEFPVVLRYDGITGNFIEVFTNGGNITAAFGISFGPDGNLYVGSQVGAARVNRYDGVTGEFTDIFASPVDSRGLIFGPDGNLYVADAGGDSVRRFDGVSGAFIDFFVPAGSGGLDFPQALEFGPDGHLYVNSSFANKVLRYDGADGTFIDEFASGVGIKEVGLGMAFGPDGNIYWASCDTDEIYRFDGITGGLIDTFISAGSGGLDCPAGVAFGPDDNLYVGSANTSQVLRYDGSTGSFIDVFAAGGGLVNPAYFTFGPEQPDIPSYRCIGFDSPLPDPGVPIEVREEYRSLPYNVILVDQNNNLVTDADLAQPPVIQVDFSSVITPNPVDVTEYSLPWWKSSEGNQFEFNNNQWKFNLLFSGLSAPSAPGTYTVSIQPGSEYLIEPTCTGTFVVE